MEYSFVKEIIKVRNTGYPHLDEEVRGISIYGEENGTRVLIFSPENWYKLDYDFDEKSFLNGSFESYSFTEYWSIKWTPRKVVWKKTGEKGFVLETPANDSFRRCLRDWKIFLVNLNCR